MTHVFSRRKTLALLAAVPLGLAAQRAAAATHNVTIQGFAFSPSQLSIAAGDTVVFTNQDGAPHTATAKDGAFDTGRLNSGESKSITVASSGTFDYVCKFHPKMTGQITAS
jgi:plastocyanin